MCGISGILDLSGAPVALAPLREMIAALRHRGPDEAGFYRDREAGLGHARLSIIGVTDGQQPMSSDDGSLWIAFNGEIFNYIELRDELSRQGRPFRTHSDTEVILRLYELEGDECVHRLNGQWAFAIWDAAKRKLFLSRDRFGVRPLFYAQAGRRFVFASEIKALLTDPEINPDLDLISLAQIFTFWVTLPPHTAFKGIHQLPPAHSLSIEKGQLRIWRYWELEYDPAPEATPASEDRCREELRALLTDAVRIRLRSDVPIGTYLSGGLDSSLVTALGCSLAGERLRSFGVSFDDPAYNESAHQQRASGALHVCHTDVRCSRRNIAEAFPAVIRHTEQPILRTAPAPLYLLSEHVRQNGHKVVLSGEGSDEVFGGYDIFKEAKIRRFWALRPQSHWRALLLRRLYPYMAGIQGQTDTYLRHFFRIDDDAIPSPFFSHLPRWNVTSRAKGFFSQDTQHEIRNYDPIDHLLQLLPSPYDRWHPFCQAQYLETAFLLPGYILSSQGDRMAMAHSVEARHPFLDHRVAAFAARLHPSLKMRVLNEKYLVKQVSKSVLPPSVVQRAKQPYRAPEGECFFQDAHLPFVDDLLSAGKIREFGAFDVDRVSLLVAKLRSGRPVGVADNMAAVGVLSTQLFVNEFIHHHVREHSC